jgi:hypothetical protein
MTIGRCPRCNAAAVGDPDGDTRHLAALSRTTRDDGADIYVCLRCGAREAYMEMRGELVPFTEWPLSVEQLVAEERIALTFEQAASIELMTITPDDAREMLGEEEADDA